MPNTFGPYLELPKSYDFQEISQSEENHFIGYHGTTHPNISKFLPAEESTLGDGGIYFTLDESLARGYGILRKEEREATEKTSQEAYMYEVQIQNARILNLTDDTKLQEILHVIDILLEGYFSQIESLSEYFQTPEVKSRVWEKVLTAMRNKIQNGNIHSGNLREIAQGLYGKVFREIITERLGYDGIIAWEGGDDPLHTKTPGISLVVYNSEKIKNMKSQKIEV